MTGEEGGREHSFKSPNGNTQWVIEYMPKFSGVYPLRFEGMRTDGTKDSCHDFVLLNQVPVSQSVSYTMKRVAEVFWNHLKQTKINNKAKVKP